LGIIREKRAISTLILIFLLFCSAVFGAIVSYMWVMSSYYNMPVDSTMLVVENATFPATNFSYFNVTVINPSNSASDVNITAFLLTIKETNEAYNVTTTEYPSQLPFVLARGTRQTFKCIENWSNFTGDTVRIEPVAADASTRSNPYVTPKAKLIIMPSFDPDTSVQYFNLTVENSNDSATSLTISQVQIFGENISVTPVLPLILSHGQTQIFRCNRNWQDLRKQNVTITVRTMEGYESSNETNELLGAVPYVSDVKFDYNDTTYFNVTISNSEDATIPAVINGADLVFPNGTVSLLKAKFPPLNTVFSSISPNKSITFMFNWNWAQYRNESITVRAYTKGDFTVGNMTTTTPPSIVWNMTSVNFDLDDLDHFAVNVTNTPCSLSGVNVTMIQLNSTSAALSPAFAFLAPEEHATFSCAINWTSFRGQTANVTVFAADGTNVSTVVMVPYGQLKLLEDSFVHDSLQGATINATILYVNITVSNSKNSLLNLTISSIVLQAGNVTQDLAESILYPNATSGIYNVNTGETVIFVCYCARASDYAKYLKSGMIPVITVTVYTAEGVQVSKMWSH
jgi:hypothetical protein